MCFSNRCDTFSFHPPCAFKKTSSCPICRAPFHHAESIAHHFDTFISLTISEASWRHYAISWNTITSLSHFCVAAQAGTVSSNLPQSDKFNHPHTRLRLAVTSFLYQTAKSHWLATSNYFMPLGSVSTGRYGGAALEKNEADWQPAPIPQELIRLPD